MFRNLFGRKSANADAAEAVAKAQIDRLRADVAVKAGAEDLVNRLVTVMQTDRGVHIESLLAIIGALAGFSAVDSAVKRAALLGRSTRDCGIIDVVLDDGTRFYFGDPINQLLGEGRLSLLSLLAGAVNQLGSTDYPDFAGIVGHVAQTIGTPAFGHPRVNDAHRPGQAPIDYVRDLWWAVLPGVESAAPALEDRIVLFGLAAQNVIALGKDVIPPATAAKLVMECAVPMSKIDPATIPAERPTTTS